jgi:hypothetical protein
MRNRTLIAPSLVVFRRIVSGGRRPDPSWEGGCGRARLGKPGLFERRPAMVLDPGREYGTGDPAEDEPEIREDQQRELEEERARDDDDLGEEAPLGPGP